MSHYSIEEISLRNLHLAKSNANLLNRYKERMGDISLLLFKKTIEKGLVDPEILEKLSCIFPEVFKINGKLFMSSGNTSKDVLKDGSSTDLKELCNITDDIISGEQSQIHISNTLILERANSSEVLEVIEFLESL